MNAAQKAALDRSMTPGFSDEDAKHILNWYVGSAPLAGLLGSSPPVGVVQAITKLGGKYQTGWGVLQLPNYQPFDEV